MVDRRGLPVAYACACAALVNLRVHTYLYRQDTHSLSAVVVGALSTYYLLTLHYVALFTVNIIIALFACLLAWALTEYSFVLMWFCSTYKKTPRGAASCAFPRQLYAEWKVIIGVNKTT